MAVQLANVDPLLLRYNGARLFQPAHLLSEGLRSSTDNLLRQLGAAPLRNIPVRCVPMLETILRMCQDPVAQLSCVDDREEFPEFVLRTKFELMPADREGASPAALFHDPGYGIPAVGLTYHDIGARRWLLHLDSPVYHWEDPNDDKQVLRLKLLSLVNKVSGVQQFTVATPFLCTFVVPHLWVERAEEVLRNVYDKVHQIFREHYVVRLREEHEKRSKEIQGKSRKARRKADDSTTG